MKKLLYVLLSVSMLIGLLTLTGCGSGGGNGTPATYSASGQVTTGIGAYSGLTLTTDSGAVATVNANGTFTFNGLANGSYTVTPSLTGHTFTPSSRIVFINGNNVVGIDFTSNSTYGAYTSPTILASEFVAALNNTDGTYSTAVQLYTNETLRSVQPGQEQWMVIWDAKFSEYKAVSLNYVRAIVYYDYYSNNKAVASEFRSIERSDILSGRLNGDTWGNDYEVVDYHSSTGYYEGRNSGYLY